jgi:hypothetical protein
MYNACSWYKLQPGNNDILALHLSVGSPPSVVFVESSLWLLHAHFALFVVGDVIHVDEVEAVPTQVHPQEELLVHHPECQPGQNIHDTFSVLLLLGF